MWLFNDWWDPQPPPSMARIPGSRISAPHYSVIFHIMSLARSSALLHRSSLARCHSVPSDNTLVLPLDYHPPVIPYLPYPPYLAPLHCLLTSAVAQAHLGTKIVWWALGSHA